MRLPFFSTTRLLPACPVMGFWAGVGFSDYLVVPTLLFWDEILTFAVGGVAGVGAGVGAGACGVLCSVIGWVRSARGDIYVFMCLCVFCTGSMVYCTWILHVLPSTDTDTDTPIPS